MSFLLLNLIFSLPLRVEYYLFENNYVEIWYQIPIIDLLMPQESASIKEDTLLIKYLYRFTMYDLDKNDSSYTEGVKGAYITYGQQGDFCIDYLPLYLYPGRFKYSLAIASNTCTLSSEASMEVPLDTATFSCSDIVLGKFNNKKFSFHNLPLTPSITREFSNTEILITYQEVYGLVPDSLYYTVTYRILDSTNKLILQKNEKHLKYKYTQIDTFILALNSFMNGRYIYAVEFYDPARNGSIARKKEFTITTDFDETAMKYYSDIQYLINPSEYKKFRSLDDNKKKTYLQDFWSKNNYWQFEKHLREADEQFSLSSLKGRDSERGKFYIKNGPPDDIEIRTLSRWARPFDVWHYYSKNYDVLFCDVKDDGNPRLIKIFKTNELLEILEWDVLKGDAEKWLFDIAPGTYDQERD